MSDTTPLSGVVDALRRRGFVPDGHAEDGWPRLRGALQPPADAAERSAEPRPSYPATLEIDPSFFQPPRVRLLTVPAHLPAIVPHLGGRGSLCYIAEGSVVLDIFDPIGQCLGCLERAESVLGRVLRGEMVEDLADDFLAYWQGPVCLVDLQSRTLGQHHCLGRMLEDKPMWWVTDDESRTLVKLAGLGHTPVLSGTTVAYRVRTTARPWPRPTHWPPQTVSDILEWQGALDGRCRRKILERLHEGRRARADWILILIEVEPPDQRPLLTYGFAVACTPSARGAGNLADLGRTDPVFSLPVSPVQVIRIDDRFVAERSTPHRQTLAGKRLALIGVGTIGGYLAELLVKAGAGTSGGHLTLVDPDVLLPKNIGRHRLGYPHIYRHKAVALAEELQRQAPGSDVRALPVDARRSQIDDADLLIDATGEEALGHWLARQHATRRAMLSVWIAGPGTAVRGLLRTGSAGACYRCLCDANRHGEWSTVEGALPVVFAGMGCEGQYVPFSAAVSVQAASLGLEMALDWVNATPGARLRTRLTDSHYRLAIPDGNPPARPDCPACAS